VAKAELVLWWARWDRAGRMIEARYRPAEPQDEAPAAAIEPETPKLRRGGLVAIQADLPL
jgi:hypothetical protein